MGSSIHKPNTRETRQADLSYKLPFDRTGSKRPLSSCVTQDGKYIISGCNDNSVTIHNFIRRERKKRFDVDPRCSKTLRGHTNYVISIHTRGKYVVTGSADRSAICWIVGSGGKYATYDGHMGWVMCVHITDDENYVVTGSIDRAVKFWKIDGTLLHTFRCEGSIKSVSVTSDGAYLIGGLGGQGIYVWDLTNGMKEIARSRMQADWVLSVPASTDEIFFPRKEKCPLCVIASREGFAHLSKVRTIERIRSFKCSQLSAVCISSGGSHLLTWVDDTSFLWNMATGQQIASFNIARVISPYESLRWVQPNFCGANNNTLLVTTRSGSAYVWVDVFQHTKRRIAFLHAMRVIAFAADGASPEKEALSPVAGQILRVYDTRNRSNHPYLLLYIVRYI